MLSTDEWISTRWHFRKTVNCDVSLTGVSRLELCQWIPMAEQAVCVIYRLAEHPDCICTNIIKHVAETAMNYHQQGEPPEASQTTPEEGNLCNLSRQTICILSLVGIVLVMPKKIVCSIQWKALWDRLFEYPCPRSRFYVVHTGTATNCVWTGHTF